MIPNEIRLEAKKELARRNYLDYLLLTIPKFVVGKHIKYLTNEIEKVLDGKERRLIITIPPQHGKSMAITESLPSYYIMKNPTKRVIIASYGDDLAKKFGRRNRQKIEEFGKGLFNIELDKCTDNEIEIKDYKGTIISRGIMSGITGQPADLIIIDDPIKNRQEADSQTYRDRVYEEWLNSLNTRLSADGIVILIQTRWHIDDLAGKLMKSKKWKVINIPCEAEDNDVLGRQKGDALFPEIGKDNKWLEEFKKEYLSKEGKRTWNALFQGHPSVDEGNIIKRKWFKFYKELPEMVQTIMSVDCTFKDNEDNDYVAIQVWGKRQADMYLIDRVKEHMGIIKTMQEIKRLKAKYSQIGAILIEDKANGSAVIEILSRSIPGIIPVTPQGGKIARANAVSPAIESGNVYLPEGAEWVEEYLDEMSAFPNAEHDDEVDCTTQALNRFMYYSAEVEIEKTSIYKDFFGEEEESTDWIDY